MRAVSVEGKKRQITVDEVLRQNAGDERFSYPTFFPADKVHEAHVFVISVVLVDLRCKRAARPAHRLSGRNFS